MRIIINRKSLIRNRLGVRSFLLITSYLLFLTSHFLLPTSIHAYSLFSGAGLGEPIDGYTAQARALGGLNHFELPQKLTLELSFMSEVISCQSADGDEDEVFKTHDFTLPAMRYFLPLPRGFGIDLGINEVLNLDFDIESDTLEYAGEPYLSRVTGRGSASIAKIGIGKHLGPTALELGGFWAFGSATEEWVTDFINLRDTYDTLSSKFFGSGVMGCFAFNLDRLSFSAQYFSNAQLISQPEADQLSAERLEFPARFSTSIWVKPAPQVIIGGGISRWFWSDSFAAMTKFSLGGEWKVRPIILRGGVYTTTWYYGDVQEKVGSLGIGIPLKSLCTIDFSFEFGKRQGYGLEETIYRACITIAGKEEL